MKKKVQGRKFDRKIAQRKALMYGLAREVLLKEKIKTTEAKAKETRMFVEKFITKAKKGDLAARRHLLKYLPERVVKKLMDDIAPRYQARNGGYTRIIRFGARKSDSAKMAIIELV